LRSNSEVNDRELFTHSPLSLVLHQLSFQDIEAGKDSCKNSLLLLCAEVPVVQAAHLQEELFSGLEFF
jgi:hypothetical protein